MWCSVLILLSHLVCTAAVSSSPNIIYIFADDLGSADVGYKGSDILTPNIDLLAHRGVILANHYVQPQCSPTRASFVTGRYPIHTGFHNANIMQGELWGLGLEEFTIGEMFQEYGYKTHAIGKWHLGWRTWRHTPINRGFHSFLGFYFCAHDHFKYNCGLSNVDKGEEESNRTDRRRRRQNRKMLRQGRGGYHIIHEEIERKTKAAKTKYFDLRENYWNEHNELVDKIRYDLIGQYSANVFTDEAIKNIESRGDDPFFMYLNYMNVHSPYQAPKYYLDKYTGHMLHANKDRKAYAAMMSSMDEGIGNITKSLMREGIYNNTIIVFASDNGANVGFCKDDHLDDDWNLNKIEPGSNFPLRGGKRSLFEGGIKSVAFVHSPLLKNKGRTNEDLIHVVDWFDTFEDIISDGGRKSRKYQIKERPPRDSISAWKSINKGVEGKRKQFLVNINTKGGTRCGPQTPHRAVRKNDWKLIVGGGGPPSGWYNPYSAPVDSPGLDYIQLFNLRTDPSETVNVAAGNPSIVIDLLRELKDYKKGVVESVRRKKLTLNPYIHNDVPTPLMIGDPRNDENFFVGNVIV